MKETLRLGRWRGISIGVNWSVLVIVVLIAEALAVGILPSMVKGRSGAEYWIAALIVAVLFFASLLAHEMAHSLVAQRHGVRVERITLWMLGGVSELSGDPPDARSDLLVAAAGPATSLVAGAAFLGLAGAGHLLGAPQIAVMGVLWLGSTNILLGLFNLLPAAPLDGGRILRAVLWMRGRDRTAAELVATQAGSVLGGAMVAAGVFELLAFSAAGGLWLMLLGWFLLASSGAEKRATLLHDQLSGVLVRDVMTPDPVCGPDYFDVGTFVERVALLHQVSGFPLRDISGEVTGLVTLRQLAAVPPEVRASLRVRDIAVPRAELTEAAPQEQLVDVLPRQRHDRAGGRILVMADGALVGILTSSDIARALQRAALRGRGVAPAA